MAAAGAKLDAYAHHPYPLDPQGESPISRQLRPLPFDHDGDARRLERATTRGVGLDTALADGVRLPDDPPDPDGVSFVKQARYESDAALHAYQTPRVEMLIHFMFRDDPSPAGWQSGFFTAKGLAKPAVQAFRCRSRRFPVPACRRSLGPGAAAHASARTDCSGSSAVAGCGSPGRLRRTSAASSGGPFARARREVSPLVGARPQVRLRPGRALEASTTTQEFRRALEGERVFW
jgi:hypothetical protein